MTVALLPVTSLLLAGGAGAAVIPGGISMPYLPFVVLAVVLGGWALVRAVRGNVDRDLLLAAAGFALGAVVVWAAMVYAARGAVTAYYPTKVLWFVTVFTWPLLALGLGLLTVWVWRRARRLRAVLAAGWAPVWSKALVSGAGVLLLAVGLPWLISFPPLLLAAVGVGGVTPATSVELGLIDPPRSGTYVPYRLEPHWDRSGVPEKIAAQVLTFRFGEPWNPLNRAVGTCALLRMADSPVIVTGLQPDEVAAALRDTHCALATYQVLTLP